MKKRWKEQEIDILINNYSISGATNLSLLLRRSKKSIEMKAMRLNLKIDASLLNELLSKSRLKPFFKYKIPNEFNLDEPQTCYFLGYLWADGYISKSSNTFGIEANSDDMNELFSHIKHIGEWSLYTRQRKNYKKQTNIYTTNPYLYQYLVDCDFLNKSMVSPDKILNKIPDYNKPYFILGIFDGDGCLYINNEQYLKQFSIVSKFEQDWSYMIKLCHSLYITNYKIINRTNNNGHQHSCFRITNKKDVRLICDYLYQNYKNNLIGLKRKHKKYCEL